MRVVVVVIALIALSGCGSFRNGWVTLKQGTVMLDNHITLYSCSGDTLRTWHTRANVTSAGGEAWWVDDQGVQHHISGTFVVQGK